jgi:hypothetical protein
MKYFLSFASSPMRRSLHRIEAQARALKLYDDVLIYDESNLDKDFSTKFAERLVHGSKGFGYWSWKAQAIHQVLQKMQDGDILQYTDSGCHLNAKGLKRLNDYFELAQHSKTGILAFQLKDPDYLLPIPTVGALDLREFKWVKGDLLDYFGVRSRVEITHTQTIGAGIIFIRKCAGSIALVNQWRAVIDSSFSLIDDTPSASANLEGFIEHRHDQAIFSLLCKLNGVDTISAYEYWYPSVIGRGPDWGILQSFPVHAKRDKDFGPLVNFGMFCQRIFFKFRRTLSR